MGESIRVSIQMAAISLLLVFLFADNVWGCEEPHGFFRAGAGWTGDIDEFTPDGDLAAQIEAGIRWPFNKNHWVDLKITHHSYWFVGWPWNEDDETTSDHINFGYEYRF